MNSEELYQLIVKSEGSYRNYYIKLLLEKVESSVYLGKLIKMEDIQLTTMILRLLPAILPEDLIPAIEKLLEIDNYKIKKLAGEKLINSKLETSNMDFKELSIVKMASFQNLKGEWIRHLFSYPDQQVLTFQNNEQAVYQEFKPGSIEIEILFNYKQYKDDISMKFPSGISFDSAFEIYECMIDQPYIGKIKAQELRFSNKEIQFEGINLTGSSYYRLL